MIPNPRIRVFLDGRDVTAFGVFLADAAIGYVRLAEVPDWLPAPNEKNTDYKGVWIHYRYYGVVTFENASPGATLIVGP